MTSEPESRRFLIHIRLGGGAQADRAHILDVARHLKETARHISNGECHLAYTSHDACTMGYFVKTALDTKNIKKQITSTRDSSVLLNDDSIMILELGRAFDGIGFSGAWSWLQHHP